MGVVGMSSRVCASRTWHACMTTQAPSMPPGCQWVIRGDLVCVVLRFNGPVEWLYDCRIGSVVGMRCTPSRGPLRALSFAAISLCHRVCCMGALWSRGLVDISPIFCYKKLFPPKHNGVLIRPPAQHTLAGQAATRCTGGHLARTRSQRHTLATPWQPRAHKCAG
jgi:hypothetical protein